MSISKLTPKHLIYLILLNLVLISTVSAQVFDPHTGEIVEDKPDSSSVEDTGGMLQYDPETGEIIHSTPPENDAIETIKHGHTQTPTSAKTPVTVTDLSSIIEQARNDGIDDTGALWYVGGVTYFAGFLLDYLVEPEPSIENLGHLSTEEVFLYVESYKNAVKKERKKRMLTGCGLYIAGIIIFSMSL